MRKIYLFLIVCALLIFGQQAQATTGSLVSSLTSSSTKTMVTNASPGGSGYVAGTTFYWLDRTTDSVYQFSTSVAYSVAAANVSYDSKSMSVSEDGNPSTIQWKPDGTRLYTCGTNDAIYEYSLTTPWDVSTGSYTGNSGSTAGQTTNCSGMFMKPDGTKAYVLDLSTDTIYQYSMSPAWDVTSLSYDSVSATEGSHWVNGRGMHISADGTELYVCDSAQDDCVHSTMSTPWLISSQTVQDQISVNEDGETNPFNIIVSTDGGTAYIVGGGTDTILVYTLSTPWDLSTGTLSYSSNALSTYVATALTPGAAYFRN